jgi:membrane glycosyltransferase
MELHPSTRLSGEELSGVLEYLDRLPLPPQAKRRLLERVGTEGDPARALSMVHRLLGGGAAEGSPADASLRARLELAGPDVAGPAPRAADGPGGRVPLVTMPRLRRSPMAPSARLTSLRARAWSAARLLLCGRGPEHPGRGTGLRPLQGDAPWRLAGALRRALLLVLVLGQTAGAAWAMAAVLPYHGERPLELAILALFTILFGWVSAAFWIGVAGFAVLLARRDRYAITRSLARVGEIPHDARTAVVMPICNEHVGRAFAGLRATYTSLARAGALERFDFFVLSDSTDAATRTAEAMAWFELCGAVDGFGRVFYRWRRHRIKRKSGNVADFCRRWGSQYRYMVVLDADSVMSGECLTALVRMMEADPTVGIIQTAPCAAGRETLHARLQQFAARVYGPLFTAGFNYWQLGESYYWGHNAIIRLAPFMRHCPLGRLPGRGVLSGEILSHDFVEAALMRRAGWSVWIAYDLPGSYEEVPATLDDELKRDRRWCRGNLLNSRLFLAEGLHPAHRAVFMAGIMSYLSAPLWLASVAISTASIVVEAVVGPRYFVRPRQLFPIWPEWHAEWAMALTAVTVSVLFAPKVLGAVIVLLRGARDFGGRARLLVSVLLETAVSVLLAPVRMVFHTLFVVAALTGLRLEWRSPPREDAETSWRDALRRYVAPTLLGIAWAAGVYEVAPAFLRVLLPVVGALALSVPTAVWSSRTSLGRRLRRARVFSIPEETRPSLELRLVRRRLSHPVSPVGLADAVLDPIVNAVACAVAVPRLRPGPLLLRSRSRLVAAALRGPAALGPRERMLLLNDPAALSQLHFEVWTSPAARARWSAERGALSPVKTGPIDVAAKHGVRSCAPTTGAPSSNRH